MTAQLTSTAIEINELKTLQKGNHVATEVWKWLQIQKSVVLVPWCDDKEKQKEQEIRMVVLDELEKLIFDES